MSDKLSDERREHLEFIERCDPAFLIMHLRNDTAFNADALESVFQLAKERARELLTASPAPAIPMPPLNDAMRAVLTNENCIYGTPDELYAALVMAAPAIPAVDPAAIIEQCAALADSMAAQGYPANVIGRDIRSLKIAPAISESEDAPWIRVEDRMPEAQRTVIATYLNQYGKRRRIRAQYIPANTRESNGDDGDLECLYDEATDKFYWPAGWYERVDNWGDYTHVFVGDGQVTHWTDMPEAPVDAARKGEKS